MCAQEITLHFIFNPTLVVQIEGNWLEGPVEITDFVFKGVIAKKQQLHNPEKRDSYS